MKKERLSKIEKVVKARNEDDPFRLIDAYKKKYGAEPWGPMPENENNPDFIKMVKEALDRGTPLTDEDYDKYFPIEPGIVY